MIIFFHKQGNNFFIIHTAIIPFLFKLNSHSLKFNNEYLFLYDKATF